MVKIEVESAEDFGDDHAVLGRHVHPHQQDGRAKVHAHDLRQHQHYDVRRFAR